MCYIVCWKETVIFDYFGGMGLIQIKCDPCRDGQQMIILEPFPQPPLSLSNLFSKYVIQVFQSFHSHYLIWNIHFKQQHVIRRINFLCSFAEQDGQRGGVSYSASALFLWVPNKESFLGGEGWLESVKILDDLRCNFVYLCSQSQTPCHVPRVTLPSQIGRVRLEPRRQALAWAGISSGPSQLCFQGIFSGTNLQKLKNLNKLNM